MSAPVTARDYALYVAALEAAAHAFTEAYDKARAEAEPVFAAKYADEGNDSQMILLPGGERIGKLTIKKPPAITGIAEGQPEAWAEEHIGDGAFEEYILPAAVTSRKVVAAVKAAHPELVKRRLRPGTKTRLVNDALKAGGWLTDPETDVKEKILEVRDGTATGAFAFIGAESRDRRARLMAELLAGNLQDALDYGFSLLDYDFGPMALPQGGNQDAA